MADRGDLAELNSLAINIQCWGIRGEVDATNDALNLGRNRRRLPVGTGRGHGKSVSAIRLSLAITALAIPAEALSSGV
jgi:hypothetical protein